VARSLLLQALCAALCLTLAVTLVFQVRDSLDDAVESFRNFYGVLRINGGAPRRRHVAPPRADARQDPARHPVRLSREEGDPDHLLQRGERRRPRRPLSSAARPGRLPGSASSASAWGRLQPTAGPETRSASMRSTRTSLPSRRGAGPPSTYLSDTPARVEIAEGDARLLSRAREGRRPAPALRRPGPRRLHQRRHPPPPSHSRGLRDAPGPPEGRRFDPGRPHLEPALVLQPGPPTRRGPVRPRVPSRSTRTRTRPADRGASGSSSRRTERALSHEKLAAAGSPLTDQGRNVALFTDDFSNLFRIVSW